MQCRSLGWMPPRLGVLWSLVLVMLLDEVCMTSALSYSSKGSEPGGDIIERAALQVEKQTQTMKRNAEDSPVPSGPCEDISVKLAASSCSLAMLDSGTEMGCECRFLAAECPAPDAESGFAAVSPSRPISLPQMEGLTVILCLYWLAPTLPSPAAEQ
mmetsp:Transcript_21403/g.47440  ORF Transcript_21403/g.47440 Transcript_21403/m.47440 type:complete len:157 (-) Transcript_21403:119-589(-)